MFTGIITDIGTVVDIARHDDWRLKITTAYAPETIALGASIACSGICLTVVELGDDWFAVDMSDATREVTTGADWAAGTKLNLERSLRVGDELGGHIVTGHVDGVGTIEDIKEIGGSHQCRFKAPKALARYLAAKGSIAIDGVSLTVNAVEDLADGDCVFDINLIPHSWTHTTFATKVAGDTVNLEIDVLARYVARLEMKGT
ncbi:MAG: riboflavin synthase [Pseudomonadota bacterium]